MIFIIRLLVIVITALTFTLGYDVPSANTGDNGVLSAVEQDYVVAVQSEEPHFNNERERLEYQVSRGEARAMTMEATAYTHTGNKTCTGTWPRPGGTIAVDPRVIPLGSTVYVEGYGYAVAEDTGGAIKGRIIDVFLDTEDECWSWGRREVKVYIIHKGGK